MQDTIVSLPAVPSVKLFLSERGKKKMKPEGGMVSERGGHKAEAGKKAAAGSSPCLGTREQKVPTLVPGDHLLTGNLFFN